jgi:dTDP-glucose 4,6-dehydratase
MTVRCEYLVTGGAGFIGSNFVRRCLTKTQTSVAVADKLTYAGNLSNLREFLHTGRLHFARADICDQQAMLGLLQNHRPRFVVNFAAESHVDRSILAPEDFVMTNVVGTLRLLRACEAYLEQQSADFRRSFRFIHVSTDEVFGSLTFDAPGFTEDSHYDPSSPYSATKAASDHIVRAWSTTYGFPCIITNCSNNYGPCQFPEKLIPLMIVRALAEESLPVYGKGLNVRDWLYVDDHCDAIDVVIKRGKLGASYNIGGLADRSNIEVVRQICSVLDEVRPRANSSSYSDLIAFVADRPGHDLRYSMRIDKIRSELGWVPSISFDEGIGRTIRWYLDNPDWVRDVQSGAYREWIDSNYSERSAVGR